MNEKFELYKVKREIEIHGKQYIFKRIEKDEYGESRQQDEVVCELSGLYHISKGYITKNVSDGGTVRSKGQPMLLTEINESTKELKQDDFVMINGSCYKLVEKNDIMNMGIIYDISLEVILDGNS